MTSPEKATERAAVAPMRGARRVRLRAVDGPDAGVQVMPDDATVTVGVSPDNSLVLTDPTVSRYHLELRCAEDGIAVEDLGSLNGTFAGAVRIRAATVPAGTRLTIGGTTLELDDGEPIDDADHDAPQLPGVVGGSVAMRELAREVHKLARSDVSVLLQGETGTGKELVAEGIHAASERPDGPFVIVDCGSMPATLIASELFGHERGAFTGADRMRQGAFERANGGTLFLDEVGELPIDLQPTLLGALERRRFRRVGGKDEIAVDVRVVSATHRDLRSAVNDGSFRADLYYRLAGARLVLPPLRDRPEDIEPLVRHFVREGTGDTDAEPFGYATMEVLRAHRWSGNVRELRNVVEVALALGRVHIEGRDQGDAAAEGLEPEAADAVVPYREARARAVARFEEHYLGDLIGKAKGNASEAARRAKMDRPYLLSLLKKHGLR